MKPGTLPSLRVAYFAGTLRPGHDGVTRVLYRLIDALERRRVQSIFYSPIIPAQADTAVPMLQVPSLPVPLNREYRLALPGCCHFEESLNAFRPHLLHIHTPCPLGLAAVAYGRRYRVPVVATYHTHFSSYAEYYGLESLAPLAWMYLRALYNQCGRVYVPSVPLLQELDSRGIRGLQVLPHGVDTDTFNPSYRSGEWIREIGAEGKCILLFVGRLVWEKDLKTLIEVYRMLSARRSDWVLAVVGDGPARREVEAAMPGAVFAGHRSGKFLSTAYASSDIFVFPSPTETFGNVVLEAMASGLVPVCVREGGAHSSVQDGITGLVARPRDAADVARCVEVLLDSVDRRSRMAARVAAYAREQTWESVFSRLFESYAEVCGLSSRSLSGAGREPRTRSGLRDSARRQTPRLAGTLRRATPGRSQMRQ